MKWLWLTLFLAGCPAVTHPNDTHDLATPRGDDAGVSDAATVGDDAAVDAATSADQSAVSTDMARNYIPVTIGDVDNNKYSDGNYVVITDVVVTTPLSTRQSGTTCTYKLWVQDPTKSTQAGLNLFTNATAGSSGCAAPSGPLVGHPQGDVVTVKGRLYVTSYAVDGGVAHSEHSIYPDSVETTATGKIITPVLLDDPNQFAYYAPGYQMYEGMLVSLTCSACKKTVGKLTVLSQPTTYTWRAGDPTIVAQFGSNFSSLWGVGKPGPTGTTAYTSITGVVNTFLSGSVEPRTAADFTP